ncbi:hypothetical protein [Streptomyces sp. 891-h]|uniref:hypothetical protein n=1 Tax=unclassified Streptomyces TaxID=2593676 RepID=UPI001FA9A95C|nr:hypothetical protein [Streptomyces sp. 891-h]UNZ15721.1 hypothetical protein HC362_00005 [Streptomyces sp. 891-h]
MPESALYEALVNGFREVSAILDQKHSTLAADPVLADLAARVESVPESEEVKIAILYALDSRELSGSAEVVQYFAHRFRWNWLRSELEKRHSGSLANVDHRLTRHYERMLEAFTQDWEDRDLFPSLDRQ